MVRAKRSEPLERATGPPALQRRIRACRDANLVLGRWRDGEKILSRVDEYVALDAILTVVQLAIAFAETHELLVRSALDDLAGFEHEDLIRAFDGREAVRDDERGAAASEAA